MKKLTVLAALLAMMLTAATPLVLAQQAPEPPPAPPAPAQQPAPAPPPGPAPAPSGFVVGCQILFNDPNAMCDVDEDGSITLPDGTKAPVVVEPDGTAYIVNDDDTVTVIGQGPSIMPDEEPPGGGQYDNAPGGGPQGPPPPPPGTP